MLRICVTVVAVIGLGGCAMPVPLQIASIALDGLSLLTTQKTLTYHGLSALAGEGCVLWRGLAAGDVCAEPDAVGMHVAWSEDEEAVAAETDGESERVRRPGQFETAAGAAKPVEPDKAAIHERGHRAAAASWHAPGSEHPAPEVRSSLVVGEFWEARPPFGGPSARSKPDGTLEIADARHPEDGLGMGRSGADVEQRATTPGGFYFVIGSYRMKENAARAVVRHRTFAPVVVPVEIERGTRYRVMVGPLDHARIEPMRQSLDEAGLGTAWGLSLRAQMAKLPGKTAEGAGST